MTPYWWKLGLSTGLLIGNAAYSTGQYPTPSKYRPWAHAKARPLARGSMLHPASWPESPLGYSVALHSEMQIANAVSSRMVLHDYDFVPDTASLNGRGKERVLRIAALLPYNRLPVVVERLAHSSKLAEARRGAVVAALVAALGPVPAERVVLGSPMSAPLQGPQAELIYLNLLRQTESAGFVPGTGVQNSRTTGAFGSGTGTFGTATQGMR